MVRTAADHRAKFLQALRWEGWRNILLSVIALTLVFLAYGLVRAPRKAVIRCHTHAQLFGKTRMEQRLKADPNNEQLRRAAEAGMFAEEDYAVAFRNCLRDSGFGAGEDQR